MQKVLKNCFDFVHSRFNFLDRDSFIVCLSGTAEFKNGSIKGQ